MYTYLKLNIFFALLMCLCAGSGQAQKTSSSPKKLTVSQDGKSDYKTIQEAIDAAAASSPAPVIIKIKNGTYREKLVVPAGANNLSIVGESKEGTIITFDDYSGKFMDADTVNNKKKFSTFNSYTMCVHANNVTLENLTVKNAAGRVGQAVALHVDGDKFIAKNCNILGNQDTIFTGGDTAMEYYSNCYIEGTTDFIFGNATVVLQDCIIKSLSDSYITAASTSPSQKFGYVFLNCKLIASDQVKKEYLGRPWRPNAKVVFIGCDLGKHIRPEGWHNWGKVENEATAYYAEYNNKGDGAATDKRVAWSHMLTEDEAKEYTLENIFKGWKPL